MIYRVNFKNEGHIFDEQPLPAVHSEPVALETPPPERAAHVPSEGHSDFGGGHFQAAGFLPRADEVQVELAGSEEQD